MRIINSLHKKREKKLLALKMRGIFHDPALCRFADDEMSDTSNEESRQSGPLLSFPSKIQQRSPIRPLILRKKGNGRWDKVVKNDDIKNCQKSVSTSVNNIVMNPHSTVFVSASHGKKSPVVVTRPCVVRIPDVHSKEVAEKIPYSIYPISSDLRGFKTEMEKMLELTGEPNPTAIRRDNDSILSSQASRSSTSAEDLWTMHRNTCIVISSDTNNSEEELIVMHGASDRTYEARFPNRNRNLQETSCASVWKGDLVSRDNHLLPSLSSKILHDGKTSNTIRHSRLQHLYESHRNSTEIRDSEHQTSTSTFIINPIEKWTSPLETTSHHGFDKEIQTVQVAHKDQSKTVVMPEGSFMEVDGYSNDGYSVGVNQNIHRSSVIVQDSPTKNDLLSSRSSIGQSPVQSGYVLTSSKQIIQMSPVTTPLFNPSVAPNVASPVRVTAGQATSYLKPVTAEKSNVVILPMYVPSSTNGELILNPVQDLSICEAASPKSVPSTKKRVYEPETTSVFEQLTQIPKNMRANTQVNSDIRFHSVPSDPELDDDDEVTVVYMSDKTRDRRRDLGARKSSVSVEMESPSRPEETSSTAPCQTQPRAHKRSSVDEGGNLVDMPPAKAPKMGSIQVRCLKSLIGSTDTCQQSDEVSTSSAPRKLTVLVRNPVQPPEKVNKVPQNPRNCFAGPIQSQRVSNTGSELIPLATNTYNLEIISGILAPTINHSNYTSVNNSHIPEQNVTEKNHPNIPNNQYVIESNGRGIHHLDYRPMSHAPTHPFFNAQDFPHLFYPPTSPSPPALNQRSHNPVVNGSPNVMVCPLPSMICPSPTMCPSPPMMCPSPTMMCPSPTMMVSAYPHQQGLYAVSSCNPCVKYT